jgi:hypothetical protein
MKLIVEPADGAAPLLTRTSDDLVRYHDKYILIDRRRSSPGS